MPQISKNQKPELIHDKKRNKWWLVFRWKLRGDVHYPVEKIDITDSVTNIFGTFPTYIWELENITFTAIQEKLQSLGKDTSDESVMVDFNRMNHTLNEGSVLKIPKMNVKRSNKTISFYSDREDEGIPTRKIWFD